MIRKYLFVLTMGLALLVMTALPTASQAQLADTTATTNGEICTNFGDRSNTAFNSLSGVATDPTKINQNGLLSGIYIFIKTTIGSATQQLFTAFTANAGYQYAVSGAMTLMVLFYAAGFMIGVVQPSFQQALIRIVKIGVIGAVISPTGWDFFNENVVSFFQDGSDQLIKGVQAIGFGIQAPAGATPFYALDQLASFFIHPDTIIAIVGATGAGGPFGLAMGGLMGIAMFGFLKLILKALEIYATTFVARSLVLGVAPIFFVFLLFDKTKNMFIAWVNALLNLSLQPILMFTFLSFFLVMIQTSAKDMLGTELCWQEYNNVDGSSKKMAFWRFKNDDKTTSVGDMTWQGSLECTITANNGIGKDGKPCKSFPLNIVDILSFVILVFLASKFADVTRQIASELSNAMVALDNTGRMEQFLQEANNKAGSSASGANKAPGDAGTPRTSKSNISSDQQTRR